MKEFNFIKGKFLERHKNIDEIEYLNLYVNTLINYNLDNDCNYSEKHHILPRCTFPEYENEKWNIIEIDYETHKLSHLYLFKAINDRKYQRPLNWMLKYYKNSEEISKAAKKGWVRLKNNKENYKNWKKKRSESMKKISSEEQRRRANIFWKNINDEDYSKFCNKIKEYWTEEKIKEKSKQMNEYYSNPENIEKKRKETQDRWNNLDPQYRLKFKEKMSKINKDEKKREDAGLKIMEKWKDAEYLEKMKNRKKRSGVRIKVIKKDGTIEIFENMQDLVRKYKLSTYLIRKYRDTNKKVSEKDLNNDNIILLNSILETIKN